MFFAPQVGIEPTIGPKPRRINSPVHYHSGHRGAKNIQLTGSTFLHYGSNLVAELILKIWWDVRDSNPIPKDYESFAPPFKLPSHQILAEHEGVEPPPTVLETVMLP